MTQRAWSTLMGCVVVGALLAGSTAAAPVPAGQQCGLAAPASTAPIFVQTLHPECCTTISSTTTEATCDSVSYSADRCEQYNGGNQCAWTCHCCKPLSSQYSYAYCGQFDSLGADRCNAVWQGTACTWTCR